MLLTAPVTVELGPSRTHERRAAVWARLGRGQGLLGIRLYKREHDEAPAERDTYRVEEQAGVPFRAGRVFLLLNRDDPGQPDAYEVTAGRDSLCTCKAGQTKHADCKHRAALAALIRGGHL